MSSTMKKTDRPREDIRILFDHELTNAPGKSIIGIHLDYPPNGFTPPHRHGGATVIAYVMAGEFTSGMNGNPPKAYKPGETFIEFPGCHHTVAENNSQTSSMQAIAIVVVDTEVLKIGGYAALTVLDEGW